MPNWDDPKNQARPKLPNIFKVEGEAAPAPQAATPCDHQVCKHCGLRIYLGPGSTPVSRQIWRHHATNFAQCFSELETCATPGGQAEAPRPSAPNLVTPEGLGRLQATTWHPIAESRPSAEEVKQLHGLVETVANAYRGYLPIEETPDVKTRLAFIDDNIRKADAILAGMQERITRP